MTQSFSGIVPALKEEVSMLKAKNTELQKKVDHLDDENRRLHSLMNKQSERNIIIAEKLALNG